MIMRGSLVMDENISNLTSTISGDQQQSMTSTNHAPPHKRKRSLPGNPDPDAEVIGLSPKTLMAANRFVCEICNKGFQRDQNLQLHRRGHNLPWKLKQRSSKEVVRKKVYVCPEAGCVHHNPARALGDLTGIKKHFSRKHGEKKWKCDKCSKRYAVQSDWKAHTKICGTRAYRCDCGTLFSRRDSFITHRAFCDALAEESGKSMTTTTTTTEDNYNNISVDNIPPWHQATDEGAVLFSGLPSAHMSATALLQKAAQMGVTTTTSSSVSSVLTGTPAATGGVLGGGHMNRYTSNVNQGGVGCDLVAASQPANSSSSSSLLLHDMIMSSFSSTTFDNHDHQGFTFTRDFLGLKPPFPQTTAAAGFGNISCLALLNSDSSSTYVYQNNEHPNHTPCQGYRPSHHP